MTSAWRRFLLAPLLAVATAASAAQWVDMPGTSGTMAIAIDRESLSWSGDTGSFWAKFVQTGYGTNSGNYQNAMFQVNCATQSIRMVDGATPPLDPSFHLSTVATPEFVRAQPSTLGRRFVDTVCMYRDQDRATAIQAAQAAARARANDTPRR